MFPDTAVRRLRGILIVGAQWLSSAAGTGNRMLPVMYDLVGRSEMATTPPEIIEVETKNVGCDGGGGALGHPLVYLSLEQAGQIDCPYCGRRFVLKEGARAAAGH
jgi:uncharacterized Zn-finger protein